jgi:hypothetical protein
VSVSAVGLGIALSLIRNPRRNRRWRCSFSETHTGKETDTIQVKINVVSYLLPVGVRLKSSVQYAAPCMIPARHCAPAASETLQRWKLDFFLQVEFRDLRKNRFKDTSSFEHCSRVDSVADPLFKK